MILTFPKWIVCIEVVMTSLDFTAPLIQGCGCCVESFKDFCVFVSLCV